MKTNRNGQALVLSTSELDLLIEELPGGVHTVLASVCRRTGCRISEARQLKWENIFPGGITFPKGITKTLESRTIPIFENLYDLLMDWKKQQELIKANNLVQVLGYLLDVLAINQLLVRLTENNYKRLLKG